MNHIGFGPHSRTFSHREEGISHGRDYKGTILATSLHPLPTCLIKNDATVYKRSLQQWGRAAEAQTYHLLWQ